MKTVTVSQIQKLDALAINKYKIPSIVLMENAGRCIASCVLNVLTHPLKSDVCIFCGLGNNAGDGFVAARHLRNAGVCPKIFLIGNEDQLKADAFVNYTILKKMKVSVEKVQGVNQKVLVALKKADLVVDAIFGVGINRSVGEPFKSLIEGINASLKYVVSVDVPSGLNATTGEIFGVCVKASTTVTLSLLKKGFYKKEGPHYTGEVVVADIGIPQELVRCL